ncbi:hypothetical protein PRTG_00013 [Prochlorococcus phage P-SSM5]|jgi:hypothetical protein|uniref:Uncharacterized protein n=2 Tax=Salacisavirus pssm2 TaxID=2734140 RepID=R9S7W3_9CAUD|nr:hypothetical protein PRTG_00013 [Prochlorococcus phage P-SSM5]
MSGNSSLSCYYKPIRQRSMTFNRFDDYLTDDAIQALMEDAISETLSDDAKKDLDSYLNSKNDF